MKNVCLVICITLNVFVFYCVIFGSKKLPKGLQLVVGSREMYTRLAKSSHLINLLMKSENFTVPRQILQLVEHIYYIHF